MLRAAAVLGQLDIAPLPYSLDLIRGFAASRLLLPFAELSLLKGLYQCAFCPVIKASQANLKRHLSEEHKDKKEEKEHTG